MKTLDRINPIRNSLKHLALAGPTARIASSLAALALASLPAHAVPTVWNVNIGWEIDSSDNFVGAAPENTANSTWNSVQDINSHALVDSTGAAGTATVQLGVVGGTLGFTGNGGYLPEIFTTWCKHTGNTLPVAVTFGGLTPSATYDLIVYGDWYWQGGAGVPITQTTGTGMSGTVTLNNFADGTGTSHALTQDTDPANNSSVRGNWIRITGLTPSGSGILGFNMNGKNAPLSGFQLIQMTAGATDTTAPTLSSFEHNKGAGPILVNEPVSYTVTFSEAMAPSSVNTDDFGNTGSAAITIDSVTPTVDPAVFLVGVTPTGAGTLQLQINAGATLTDLVPLSLVTTSAISDDSTLVVNDLPPTPTTTTVVSSVNPSTYGQNVTFTATVLPIPSGGTIQFYNGLEDAGTPVAVNTTTGEATYSTSALAAGTHPITAEYSGNFAFATSTSSELSQVVDKAPLTVTASNVIRLLNTANPDPLSYQITGYQNGENLASSGVTGTPDLTTTAVLSSPLGTYPITCAPGTLAADNYSFTLVNGTLTVTNLACQVGVLNLSANGGINPATGNPWAAGDKYRLIFVTSGNNIACDSSDITTYNTAVQDLANASTAFPALGSVTWKVVGSTATVNARDNTGTSSGIGEPIVRMDGTFIIANDYADLWNGIIASHEAGQNFLAVHLDENGVARTDDRVRTGTNVDGTAHPTQMLGSGGNVQTGRNFAPDSYGYYGGQSWMADWNASGPGRVYAISAPLTIQTITPANTFNAWANANNAENQTPDQDHDNDGVENGVEYFMGQTGSSFTAMPGLDGTNTVTWPMVADYQGTYEVQTSPDLVTWTNVDPKPLASGGNLSYTLPTGLGKRFVRLLVTPTP